MNNGQLNTFVDNQINNENFLFVNTTLPANAIHHVLFCFLCFSRVCQWFYRLYEGYYVQLNELAIVIRIRDTYRAEEVYIFFWDVFLTLGSIQMTMEFLRINAFFSFCIHRAYGCHVRLQMANWFTH